MVTHQWEFKVNWKEVILYPDYNSPRKLKDARLATPGNKSLVRLCAVIRQWNRSLKVKSEIANGNLGIGKFKNMYQERLMVLTWSEEVEKWEWESSMVPMTLNTFRCFYTWSYHRIGLRRRPWTADGDLCSKGCEGLRYFRGSHCYHQIWRFECQAKQIGKGGDG